MSEAIILSYAPEWNVIFPPHCICRAPGQLRIAEAMVNAQEILAQLPPLV